MSKPTNPRVRYVRVEIRPALWARFDGPTIMEAEVEVQTDVDQYNWIERIPMDDFMRRFDGFLERAGREITDKITGE